jgi:coniferyl-aldehyde dehydrogenase
MIENNRIEHPVSAAVATSAAQRHAAVDPAHAFAAARAAQAREPFPDWPLRTRRLHALEALIRDNHDAIVAAISADFGRRPAEETELLEIFPSVSCIRHALKHGRRWMRPRRHWAGFWFLPARTEILPQPLGVVGIIVPWNYPLYLAIGPLIDALAAGNRVLMKMSEYTPRFSALFAELVAKHFPAGEVAVINGDAGVARTFAALPFDHLLFTGSTAVGREVMRAAAANLTPVTLELGGKSPAIIGPHARFEHAVERIMVGKLLNAGQTCIAPDYVLLPRERVPAFIDAARAIVATLYPQLASNTQYASIASDRHYARLTSLRDAAVASGATAHALADVPTNPATRVFPPTLLSGVDEPMRVMQEEIFGPLLPLVAYATLDDALAYVAAHPHPLALYVFDDDRTTVDTTLARTLAGGVSVNDTILHIAQHHLPFGGVGASGMGAYHGEDGFRTFSRMKPVFRQARWNATGALNPPYGNTFRRMIKILLGR